MEGNVEVAGMVNGLIIWILGDFLMTSDTLTSYLMDLILVFVSLKLQLSVFREEEGGV